VALSRNRIRPRESRCRGIELALGAPRVPEDDLARRKQTTPRELVERERHALARHGLGIRGRLRQELGTRLEATEGPAAGDGIEPPLVQTANLRRQPEERSILQFEEFDLLGSAADSTGLAAGGLALDEPLARLSEARITSVSSPSIGRKDECA
jgi:hypothetical protein